MGKDKAGRTAGNGRVQPWLATRVMRARRNGTCPVCKCPILVGQQIAKREVWQHIAHVVFDVRER